MLTSKLNQTTPVVGSLLSAAFTSSFNYGITEPIEFTFLFVAPTLWSSLFISRFIIHVNGYLKAVFIGMTFSEWGY